MLAGVVVSAVTGGMAGLVFALGNDQGLLGTLLAYQLGGLLSVLGFITLSPPLQMRRS